MSLFKKSPNKSVTWNVGWKCQNCNKTSWRLLKEYHYEGERYIHFYCSFCMAEVLKHCDYGSEEEIVKLIKDRKGEKK